jgi:ribonuclease P protein component
MLPRHNRLKESSDFDNIFKKGRKLSTSLFLLAYVNRGDEKPTRIGVVAGKKVGGAVQRNRAKRIMREASKVVLERLPLKMDMVIIANSNILSLTSAGLADTLRNLIAKIAL